MLFNQVLPDLGAEQIIIFISFLDASKGQRQLAKFILHLNIWINVRFS